ncbi:MAG TPA: hypothetical protein VHL11_09435 [Phototrophicaceae bacterium]|jgi:hypothetical protein|nr:hypothetical protein [Phototrophicaceae bacterium]
MDSSEEQRIMSEAEVMDHQTSASDFTPEESFWDRLRRWFMPSSTDQTLEYQQRLDTLDDMIVQHPEAPSNYVLRGELHLDAGFVDLAVSDFQKALSLASHQFEIETWGIITQTMRDRAMTGLERALRLQRR